MESIKIEKMKELIETRINHYQEQILEADLKLANAPDEVERTIANDERLRYIGARNELQTLLFLLDYGEGE